MRPGEAPVIGLVGDYRHDTCQAPQVATLMRTQGLRVVEVQKNLPLATPAETSRVANLLRRAGVLYNIGRNTSADWYFELARSMGLSYVNHWVGSDVLELGSDPAARRAPWVVPGASGHLACAPWIADELAGHGVDAQVLPIIPIVQDVALDPAPGSHAVLAYAPTGKSRFYGLECLLAAARQIPGLPFHVTGNDGTGETHLDNVHYHGWLSGPAMTRLYRRCSILLRTPAHDGLSMMVLEAMGKGKEVIYSYDVPHCRVVHGYDEIVEALKEITDAPPRANVAAHDYVAAELSRAAVGAAYGRLFAGA